jgi:hypothetical protein
MTRDCPEMIRSLSSLFQAFRSATLTLNFSAIEVRRIPSLDDVIDGFCW